MLTKKEIKAIELQVLKNPHPCTSCGACCAFFRVEFYWREANSEDSDCAVPLELVEDLTPQSRAMKGTTVKHNPKCIALQGTIGKMAFCGIYDNRSSVCRKFGASFEKGSRNERCDQARIKHGLAPLRREDWGREPEQTTSSDAAF